MQRTLTFVKAGLFALTALACQACFDSSSPPYYGGDPAYYGGGPAYYGGGPAYYSSSPEYVPYYAGRPVEKNYYYEAKPETAQAHNDNWFHRNGGQWRNGEGETPKQEKHEQSHEKWEKNH